MIEDLKPAILCALVHTVASQVSVGGVEQLIKALVDGILRVVDQEQWKHVLEEMRDVLDMGPPVLGFIFVQ